MNDPTLIDTFVYVIGTRRDGRLQAPTKVGISAAPGGRLINLQTASPYDLVLVKTFRLPSRDVAIEIESCFHATQSDCRLKGEWFDIDPDEAAIILACQIRWAIGATTNLNEAEQEIAFKLTDVA